MTSPTVTGASGPNEKWAAQVGSYESMTMARYCSGSGGGLGSGTNTSAMSAGDPRPSSRLRLKAALAGFLALAGASRLDAAAADIALSFHPAELAIYSGDGTRLLGHGRYTITHLEGAELVSGENKFLDGERDVEEERIELRGEGIAPRLATFQHSFFNADGSAKLLARLDLKSGFASCTSYLESEPRTRSANLELPPDTYAGASLTIPISAALRQAAQRTVKFHAFNCVPDPRVVAVEARVGKGRSTWPFYPGDLVRVDVRPDLGWMTFLAAPLLPKIYAWFDPEDDWNYVGGRIERYYRGPRVMMVRVSERSFESGAPAFHLPDPDPEQ